MIYVIMLDHQKKEVFIYSTSNEKKFYQNHNVIGDCFASDSYNSMIEAINAATNKCLANPEWRYNAQRNSITENH